RGDVGEPVVEPGADRRRRGLGDRSGVTLALEFSHLVDDGAAGLAGDVPPVELAVELVADGDVAVPPPVGALVDRRLTVRRASRHCRSCARGPGSVSWTALTPAGALWTHADSGEGF